MVEKLIILMKDFALFGWGGSLRFNHIIRPLFPWLSQRQCLTVIPIRWLKPSENEL